MNDDTSPFSVSMRALASEYQLICEVLEREITQGGLDRFIRDTEWRDQQRTRARAAREQERIRENMRPYDGPMGIFED